MLYYCITFSLVFLHFISCFPAGLLVLFHSGLILVGFLLDVFLYCVFLLMAAPNLNPSCKLCLNFGHFLNMCIFCYNVSVIELFLIPLMSVVIALSRINKALLCVRLGSSDAVIQKFHFKISQIRYELYSVHLFLKLQLKSGICFKWNSLILIMVLPKLRGEIKLFELINLSIFSILLILMNNLAFKVTNHCNSHFSEI